MPVSPKVVASTGGVGASTPFSVVLIWVLTHYFGTLPPEVIVSIATLIGMGAAWVGGYVMPHVPPPPAGPTSFTPAKPAP